MARPKIEITDEIIKDVEQMAAQGLTQEQIADSLGWVPSTLYAKKRVYKEFSEAIKKGKASGLKTVTNNLFTQSGSGNVAATIFYLKNRDKDNWSDQDRAPDVNIILNKLTDKELIEIANNNDNK